MRETPAAGKYRAPNSLRSRKVVKIRGEPRALNLYD
jgi:hypothetical protein